MTAWADYAGVIPELSENWHIYAQMYIQKHLGEEAKIFFMPKSATVP